ncbi:MULTISPECIES: hypothetical protein [unclassified Empedobacter]|uniref:hypothetical protein n=1 Tax=unclassified Empedobacter TaxID=2643773 RepID=UPI0025C22DA3|nr:MULTISPECIES: hypothetical protein [unclassified Empedobacter]
MIDFLQLNIIYPQLIEYFRNHKLLTFKESKEWISKYDDEVINTKITKHYKQILFIFYEKNLVVKFKPHYYKNNNLHNADAFSVNDCINVIKEFKEVFSLTDEDLKLMLINNIEFGLNVKSPIDEKKFIDYLSFYNQKEFSNKSDLKHFKECFSSLENIIKAYSKYVQYPEYCEPFTYRFDIKHRKARVINDNYNIYSMFDLMNFDCYLSIRDAVIKFFNNILILHYSVNTKGKLTEAEEKKLLRFINPYSWKETKDYNKNTFSRRKTSYNKLLDKTGFNIHSKSLEMIIEKLDKLMNGKNKNVDSPHINIGWESTLNIKRICPITGISLENEKAEAKYIQTKTLKKLKEEEEEVYNLIKHNLLHNSKQKPKFESSEFSHLAKQIRNNYYNPKRTFLHSIPATINQLNLF